jgi:hypothetical protein
MNLYLPDSLKADMDAISEVKWSQVAQVALRNAVEIHRRKQVDITSAQLERLRAGRARAEDLSEADAVAAGKRWALENAEYEELKAVAELASQPDEVWRGEPDAYGWGRMLLDAIHGEGEWTRSDLEDFCSASVGSKYPEAYQVRGFIEGAAEVFDKVEEE